ncbi:protein fantom isoform X3 [Phyllopteryx taeniolatus]|uniref:protein fantom isoform X3 n=1 Tax=Phyllopteryx taeniolatus TaxID=161469 RepID=UPI002AD4EDE3|nr:protein fantom isoform X3 [Phyllopteryx taeniolatus]
MSPMVDETAGDLPVRDVGLMRGGLMPAHPEAICNVKPWKKHHIMISKDPQRLFRLPRDQLEDLCLHMQEENVVLRKHTQAQEQKMRRMSTRLMRLHQARPGSGGAKEKEMEDALQELETRLATLESQKVVLHNKLSLAKQHILDLGGRTPYRFSKGKSAEVDGGVRRATHTAPPRDCPTMEDTRGDVEKFSVSEPMRVMELELTTRTLRDTLREKEKEMEGTVREMKRQQAERHKINIRENVDVICLQKQLSEKSVTLRVTQEKIADLQKVYENQLEESQRSLRESQTLLLEKAEELSEQLKQERDRALTLEAQLTTANLSLQNLDKLQERIKDLEGEKERIKENYDSLLESTLSTYNSHDGNMDKHREVIVHREEPEDSVCRVDIQLLTEMLQTEKEQRSRLQSETEKLRHEKEILEEQHKEHLEEEVLQYKEQMSGLQNRLDSVTKVFDMSAEELSETLLQIKAFRMQQESREGLRFLEPEGTREDLQLTNIQASHAETVLELQKTRSLLLLEHRISKDLQGELETMKKRLEREEKEVRMAMAEKDNVLSKRARQINALQAQLKAFAYSTKNHKGTMPVQYTWPAGDQEVVQPFEDDILCAPLRLGESLLELHIKAATFTPGSLRNMGNLYGDQAEDMVTFCTYSLLDFEVHSTPLVEGSQPKYGFTSRYALTARDLGRLRVQGSRVRVELHQAMGGVRFVTHGSGHLSLIGAMERKGERMNGYVNITGSEGEIVGVVDFWARLFPPAEPREGVAMRDSDGNTATQTIPTHITLGWREGSHAELYDYGGGIPNELLLLLEHCEGLRGQWPGILPDAYLTYRLYDLQPHVSKTVQGAADPIFHDTASYPLAVTADVLHYLRSSSLWVYVFDDSDDQIPPAYLAKTPIPLRALATGKEITGDYVLRDPAGGPRGTVRVLIKWKYPFQSAAYAIGSSERRREEPQGSQRPIAKPRVKQLGPGEPRTRQKKTNACPAPDSIKPDRTKRSDRRSLGLHDKGPPISLTASSDSPPMSKSQETSFMESRFRKSSASETGTRNIPSVDVVSVDEVEELEEETKEDVSESATEEPSESSNTSTCDHLIIPPRQKTRQGHKLRVEILSLTFEPSSHVALDNSVQRVYVEYRLLGVPVETTETPVSLRKPTAGEEIHYNFTRVIYVDGSLSVPLRQYLYTMLEGTDPNKGRLKFTIVSEPMDDDEECADVGYAFLDLQELLLTGNDVIERQIDIVRVDEEQEVIGFLKVSLKAAKALSCIYKELHRPEDAEDDGEHEEKQEEKVEQREKNHIKVIENHDSDF